LDISQIALKNSLFTISLHDKEKLIGSCRVVRAEGLQAGRDQLISSIYKRIYRGILS
jgi:hypothetical protein